MIEIRRIREFTSKGKVKKADKPFDPELYTENIHTLFSSSLPDLIEKIPEKERFNCYYTLGHAPENKETKSRKWTHQEVIPFDIDNCDYIEDSPDPRYIEAIEKALGVDIKKCVVIATGNGLQVLVKPRFIINDPKFFELNQKFYSALCLKVAEQLKMRALKGEPDPSAFQPNRLFRLPLTFNIKPDKPKRLAQVMTGNLESVDFDLAKASGLPAVNDSDALSEKELTYFKIDTQSVEDGCEFLKYAKANQKDLQEPQWYAVLSIVGRLENGHDKAHLYSKDHPNYSPAETDRKLKQSIDASGPRTCANINTLWGKCRECPNFKRVNSPIAIRSPNFIATEDTGFHIMGPRGQLIPQYMDLLKYYDREKPFINLSGVHYTYDKTHYIERRDEEIEKIAQEKFNPPCNNTKASEFRGVVKRTNIVDNNFFQDSTSRKINLKNGVLNIDTMKLSESSPRFGFKYVLDFEFDPIAQAPLFSKMLADVTCGDENLQKILLEYMGYAISNDEPVAQKFLMLTGEGSNGKSTFVKILKKLGGHGAKSLTEKQLASSFDVIALDGALFNVFEEVPRYLESEFWERLKALATGASVTASKKFKDAYEFSCRCKFILVANNLPRGGDPSHGLYRRFLTVPFNAKFDKDTPGFDRHMADKIIETEMPGVLNMVLEGYHRLRENNYEFTSAEAVQKANEDYIRATDPVADWAEDCLIPSDLSSRTADLYTHYVNRTEADHEKPVSLRMFVQRVMMWAKRKNLPVQYTKVYFGKNQQRAMWGVALRDNEDF